MDKSLNIKGMEMLSDDALGKVTGGAGAVQMMAICCPRCNNNITVDVSKSFVLCPKCNLPIKLFG